MKVLIQCVIGFSFCLTIALAAVIPPSLQPRQSVALASSGFRVESNALYREAVRRLQALDLRVETGKAVTGHHWYFAGTDVSRAADINEMFANPKIHGIFEIRGGWGSARILPTLDYAMIANNPKILIGFSDITSLLIALYTQSHLVTYYGPMPGSYTWPSYTTTMLKKVLFQTKAPVVLSNPKDDPIQTITPGKAQGVLLGGNLSVLVSMIGTPYFPKDWHHKILFVEDTHEDVYAIDRMLTQLQQAGILSQISGFIFGQCTACTRLVPGSPDLKTVIEDHIQPLGIPAWMNSEFGHQSRIMTIPEGEMAQMDASHGVLLLTPA